jgi:hypothetical protein
MALSLGLDWSRCEVRKCFRRSRLVSIRGSLSADRGPVRLRCSRRIPDGRLYRFDLLAGAYLFAVLGLLGSVRCGHPGKVWCRERLVEISARDAKETVFLPSLDRNRSRRSEWGSVRWDEDGSRVRLQNCFHSLIDSCGDHVRRDCVVVSRLVSALAILYGGSEFNQGVQ